MQEEWTTDHFYSHIVMLSLPRPKGPIVKKKLPTVDVRINKGGR